MRNPPILAAAALLATALLAVTGPASACSVLYEPYQDPSWNGALRYIDGTELRVVRDGLASAEAEGWFLSYAARPGKLAVAGQDGLGAGCEGDAWFRLTHNGATIVEMTGSHRVFDHADGAIVVATETGKTTLYRWSDLQPETLPAVPADAWVLGWSQARLPVYVHDGDLVAGGRTITVPAGTSESDAAPGGGGAAIVLNAEDRVHLVFVPDAKDGVATISWDVAQYGQATVAWRDGWYVAAHGRAYHVTDRVVDLGLNDVQSVGATDDHAIVFHGDRYTTFDGQDPQASAQRVEQIWVARAPTASPTPVEAAWESSAPPTSDTPTGSHDSPAAPAIVGVAVLFSLGFLRRRNP